MPDLDAMTRDELIVDVLKVMNELLPCGLSPSQGDGVRSMLMAFVPGPRQGDLFDEQPREGNRLVKAAMAMVCGKAERHARSLALAIKVAITVGHLRARRWDRLQASEALAVAEALDVELSEKVTGDARCEVVTVGPPDAPVEFMFPWRPGNAGRGALLGTSTSHVALVEIDPVDAPVTCSLRTPEGRLALRRLESGWLRPVLSPGSWRPITAAEFRDTARSGCAWSDNPFLPRLPRGLPKFHVLDVVRPQPLTAANARRTSAALDACLAGAGQLHVIDGIVHRSTDAPTAGVVTTFTRVGPVTGPAWRTGDLASTRDMGTFGDVPVATWFNGVPIPDQSGSDDPDAGFVGLADWTGMARLTDARVRRNGGAVTPRVSSTGDLLRPFGPLPCAPDVHGCLRVAANLARRLLPLAHVTGSAGGGMAACVRLEEALAAWVRDLDGREEAEAASLTSVSAWCEEVLGIAWLAEDPRGGMWDYVASLVAYAADHAAYAHDDDQALAEVVF